MFDKRAKPQIVAEGKYLRFVKKAGWEYVQRNNCTGIVIIFAMSDDGKVVFTEQYRPPVNCRVIENAAGLVNDQSKKESFSTAARRELLEETGYKAKKMVQIVHGPVSGGLTSDLVYIFLAKGLKKISNGGGDHTENIKVHEIPLKQVPQWLRQKEKEGCLVDPKVYAGLYFFSCFWDGF